MVIRLIKESEVKMSLDLVLKVFMEFEAPDYSFEGIETFKKTGIEDTSYVANLVIYGAFDENRLVGVIATRSKGTHIALFFVDGIYHRQGIGKKLFEKVVSETKSKTITVNSSPYAKEVYHHLGFTDTDKEQNVQGIRFTPMVYINEK